MNEYLTTGEFVRWASQFDKKLDQHIAAHADTAKLVQDHEVQLQVMAKSSTRSKGVSGVIATIVAGLISGLVAYAQSGTKP